MRIRRRQLSAASPCNNLVVLLTGFLENDRETFEDTIALLESRGYKVLVIHLPDHRSRLALRFSWAGGWPKRIHRTLQEIYKENGCVAFDICVYSMGGPCQKYAWAHSPELFRKIMLVSSADRINPLYSALLLIAIGLLGILMLIAVGGATTAIASEELRNVGLWIFGGSLGLLALSFFLPIPKAFGPSLPGYRWEDEGGVQVTHNSIPLFVAIGLLWLQHVARMAVREHGLENKEVLLIHGVDDGVVPVEETRDFHEERRDTTYVEVRDAGHFVLTTHWKDVSGNLEAFFPQCIC